MTMTDESTDTFEAKWDAALAACEKLISEITFKKFKHLPSLSEETECFTADVYWNGKLVAYASNHGHGGNTDIHFTDAVARVAMTNAVADALRASPVPTLESWDFESVIDEAVNAELNRRDIEKQRKAFAKKCHAKGFNMICLADGTMLGRKPGYFGNNDTSLHNFATSGIEISPEPGKPLSKVVAFYPLPTK